MKLWVLGSGSRGNAVVIESAGTRVLIDAGFAPPVLLDRLRTIDVAPESIEALVITHEHTDHLRGARVAAERFGWTVHATAGTIISARDLRDAGAIPFRAGDTLAIGDFDLLPVKAPHDAAEPVVIVATARTSGARAGIAYDLGCATQPITEALERVDLLVLEANHDEAMLHHGPYPESVRRRIAGRRGHLSNGAAGMLAKRVAHGELRHVILAHLSETCNTPELAVRAVTQSLVRTRFAGRITPALQNEVAGPFRPGEKQPGVEQLGFDF
jgi:phosphoribosyl 1,2-cyclic phosphodiesterase